MLPAPAGPRLPPIARKGSILMVAASVPSAITSTTTPASDMGAAAQAQAVGTGARAARPEAEAPRSGPARGARLGTSLAELPPQGESGADKGQRSSSDLSRERRSTRYRRRQRSAYLLVTKAREERGLDGDADEVADPETGELRQMTAHDPEWVRPPRAARCRWRIGTTVGLHHGDGAHWSGIERCGSIWACPVCAGVIRAGRARDLGLAVERHRDPSLRPDGGDEQAAGGFVFVTLTMQHGRGDALAVTLDAAIKAWQRMLRGAAWARFKARFGVIGYVRSVEVTLGVNGWHPHLHLLFLIAGELSDDEVTTWHDLMYGRWARYVVQAGGGLPSHLRGVDVRASSGDATVLSQYLTKLQEGGDQMQRVEHEVARGDMKDGRSTGGGAPFELLDDPGMWNQRVWRAYSAHMEDVVDDARPTPAEWAGQRWIEFYESTHGRRAITWSVGLRERLIPDVEDRTDAEELEEGARRAERVVVVSAAAYDARRNDSAVLTVALDLIERGEYGAAAAYMGGTVQTGSQVGDLEDREGPPDAA